MIDDDDGDGGDDDDDDDVDNDGDVELATAPISFGHQIESAMDVGSTPLLPTLHFVKLAQKGCSGTTGVELVVKGYLG